MTEMLVLAAIKVLAALHWLGLLSEARAKAAVAWLAKIKPK